MDNQAFDKRLAEKLDTLPEYSPRKGDWQSVQARLSSGRSTVGYWLIPLLLLLGLNGWLGYQWHCTQRQYHTLQIAVDSLRQQPMQYTTTQADTVYRQTIVYHYDTVYRTIVYQYTPQSDEQYPIDGISSEEKTKDQAESYVGIPNDTITTVEGAEKQPRSSPVVLSDSTNDSKAFTDTLLILIALDTASTPDSSVSVVKEKVLRWRNLRLGLSAHLPFTGSAQVSQGNGWGGGISASVSMMDRVRWAAHVQYLSTGYSVSTANESLEIINILNGSIYQNDELLRIQNRQSQLQWGAELQYYLTKKSPWRPFVALTYLVETPIKRGLIYSLRDVNTDKVYMQERSASLPTYWHVVDGGLGIERHLSYRYVWQLSGFFNNQLSPQTPMRLDQIGIRTRWYYQF